MVKYYYRYRVSNVLLDSRGIYRGNDGKYIITDTGYHIYCWTPEEFTEEMMVKYYYRSHILLDSRGIYRGNDGKYIITDTGYPIYCWTPEEFTEEMMVNISLQIQGITYTAGLRGNDGKYIITDTGYPIYCWTPEEFTEEMMVKYYYRYRISHILLDSRGIYRGNDGNILLQIQGIPYTAGLPRNLPRK